MSDRPLDPFGRLALLTRGNLLAVDKVLLAALAAAFLLCLNGITSRYLHPDQMAFVPLFQEGKWPFNPGWFEKPPFHTYLNYFLTLLPVSLLDRLLNLPPDALELLQRLWSKVLTAALFLGAIGLLFKITRTASGRVSARIVTLLFATSAGFVTYSHFLTADIPVMFWMLLAFFFSQRILLRRKLSDYLLAGFLTGLAAATKYNGLAIGLTIVVAHWLALASLSLSPRDAWRQYLFDRKLLLGLSMVVAGFVAGNPYALLDHKTFAYDFAYNYMVAPVYEGQTGHSFARFFTVLTEIYGLPALLLLAAAGLFAFFAALSRKGTAVERGTFWLGFSVLLIYYLKFGSFPRLETRFVVPVAPLLLIVSCPFWKRLKAYKAPLAVVLAGLLAYNLLCSFYVGQRFLEDPRAAAEAWVAANVPPGSLIEGDIYAPDWNAGPQAGVESVMSPFVTGRERLFREIFKGNSFINGPDDNSAAIDETVAWYSPERLNARRPDFVAVDSLYYDRFTAPGLRRDLYPSMDSYFRGLLGEKLPYDIVFDRETSPLPFWIYPREIDFLHNRITILRRRGDAGQ